MKLLRSSSRSVLLCAMLELLLVPTLAQSQDSCCCGRWTGRPICRRPLLPTRSCCRVDCCPHDTSWTTGNATIIAGNTGAAAPPANSWPPPGAVSLFNQVDLSGWRGLREIDPRKWADLPDEERQKMAKEDADNMGQHWRVENGEIVNDGQGVYLATDSDFRDYELWIEYKTVAGADSGIYLKATPQVQIWDYTEAGGKWNIGADKGSGGLWNNAPGNGKDPLVLADRPFGEWNRVHVLQIGGRTSVWLNDQLVVDWAILENYWDKTAGLTGAAIRPLVARGPIQLQTHGGEIRWRNIYVREIAADEANSMLASRSGDGFARIFNGRDLEGWAGPVENFEVVNGTLRCKPHQGGTIFTQQEFSDFEVHFEFKLPPAGNNGLAIRYPGEGDSAYVGMCELQILDNEHPNYAGLDSRQFHGSAYGMVAAHRGYLRPTGEWNFQRVKVFGSKIEVELNGTLILDADLSTVRDFLSDTPHPGKDRTSGHFGFCGHHDPVEFRNVFARTLTR